ncbi:hypothetical protein [Pseudomonas putida]|uniref:hypothetical protein n=1 Tax=Pseudomonas putida TaxID=303 RepID=UPI002022E9B7|nr:hypothetical protein [Pseudomonas putida]MCL8304567.1 hypothetical protein [Pseudomonas putida]
MTKIAYLDISPRQTGKTARMVKLAQEHLERGQKVCFVTLKGLVPGIQTALPHALVLEDGAPFPASLDADAFTWFYDEFDFLKHVQVRQGGFYATTPRFIRKLGEESSENDMLLQLIHAAGGRFERFYWTFDMDDGIREARVICSPDEFRRLYLCEVFA